MDPWTTLWLLVAAVPIGIFGVVFGGNLFLSLPLFQIMFPDMVLGAMIGNIKPGSIVRNLASLVPLRKHIMVQSSLLLVLALSTGSIVGATFIASLSASRVYVIPVLILGWLVMISAPRLGQYVSHIGFMLTAFVVGMYGGIFGAGISLLIVALLRLRHGATSELLLVRANSLYLETILTFASVFIFLYKGLVDWRIALVWAIGSIVGGYLGGLITVHTGKMRPVLQKAMFHTSFGIALVVATLKVIR